MKQIIPWECPHCGNETAYLRHNGPHLEARCERCDRHLQFVSKSKFSFDERFTTKRPAPQLELWPSRTWRTA